LYEGMIKSGKGRRAWVACLEAVRTEGSPEIFMPRIIRRGGDESGGDEGGPLETPSLFYYSRAFQSATRQNREANECVKQSILYLGGRARRGKEDQRGGVCSPGLPRCPHSVRGKGRSNHMGKNISGSTTERRNKRSVTWGRELPGEGKKITLTEIGVPFGGAKTNTWLWGGN